MHPKPLRAPGQRHVDEFGGPFASPDAQPDVGTDQGAGFGADHDRARRDPSAAIPLNPHKDLVPATAVPVLDKSERYDEFTPVEPRVLTEVQLDIGLPPLTEGVPQSLPNLRNGPGTPGDSQQDDHQKYPPEAPPLPPGRTTCGTGRGG